MKDLSNWIKEKNSEYTKIIDEIEYAIKNIKELLEKKKQSDNNLLKLFESMIDTYEVTKKLNNYQIRKSIKNFYSVKDIFKIEEKNAGYYSLIYEFKKMNLAIKNFTNKKILNDICYLNLLHCPTCKDYIKIESIDTKNLEFNIKCYCPKNSHKFENKNLSEFINENKQNINYFNYLCYNHNECYKYFCLKCNVNFCEKCKEHDEHKGNVYDLSKEISQISDINNKKIDNKKKLENIDCLQKEFEEWIKEFNLKMINYFANIKCILHIKDEIFNYLENKKYNYSYVLSCNYIINKLQIEKILEPKFYQKICHILLNMVMIF